MAREPKIAYVLFRNAHSGPRLAASVELCVRDLALHSRLALDPGRLPAGGPAVRGHRNRVDPRRADQRQSRKGLGRRPALKAARRRSRHCRKSLAGRDAYRVDLRSAGDFAYPCLCESAVERAGWRRPGPGAAPALRLRLRQRIRAKSLPRRFPRLASASSAVPNGLDMRAWSAAKPKDRSIVCVGRALRGKGHLEAMAAIARALPRGPNGARASWCPTPWPRTRSREPFERFAIWPKVSTAGSGSIRTFPTPPRSKAAWESAAVGMVLTTGPEPFGRTALEALASGAALITSGRGGLAEICGPCAMTVDPGEADSLAAALGQLLDAAERRAGARARRARARRAAFRYPDGRAANGRFHRGLPRRRARTSLVIRSRTPARRVVIAGGHHLRSPRIGSGPSRPTESRFPTAEMRARRGCLLNAQRITGAFSSGRPMSS